MVPDHWKRTTIGKINKVTSGGTPSRTEPAFWGGRIPWVTTSSIDFNVIVEATEYLTEFGLANSSAKLFPPDTILVGLYGDGVTRGKVAMLGIQAATNQACAAILPSENVQPKYLFYYLASQYEKLRRNSSDGNQKNLSGSLIKSYPIVLPPENEQLAISSVLSIWDRAIELTEKLIIAKDESKQALMQQLLGKSAKSNRKHQKLGTLFAQRKTKGSDDLPTYSVTINEGLVLRDSLERKNETSLRPDQHLLIEKDDIAYNMMRMWQGASGLAPESGLVSPAYVVLRSLGDVDPLFASYWFKVPRVVKKFEDYSHGLTKDRLRLYFKDFASITLPVPPLDLQRKIAKTLAVCDLELDCLRQKVDLLKQQKKGLMQQLLTGKVRIKLPKAKGKK